ncbi:MAG: arylsulfatase [candidate division WS1 bacterium]|jgi:arylsulfatase A-like enzyme|nr:arylsulfatase [candidate division WS1 bacterium]
MSESNRPNIVLFTTDQHRGDWIGLAGRSVIETPNLDAWVNEGLYFPNAYTEIPSTTGARRILHMGQGSYDCGVIGYAGGIWDIENSLPAVLARAGYHCFSAGWRNMHPRRALFGYHQAVIHDLRPGVDDYMDWLERELGPSAHERGHGSDANGWLARPWHLEERYHPTVWTTDVALDLVEKRDPTKPFFLWCSHLRPHSPYDPPQFYWDMYDQQDLGEPPIGDWADRHRQEGVTPMRTAWQGNLGAKATHRCRAGYMGCITHIDYEMGRMEESLMKMEGVDAANTIWLFTADHGDMMGDHYLHRKTYAYEGSARIPFVVRYPKGYDAPTGAFEQPVGLQDVMPTLLDIAGVESPDTMTGESVVQAARGGEWREFIHGEHSPCYHPTNAVQYLTDGREKFLWFPVTGQEQFFDLQNDRDETRDLINDPAAQERVKLWRQRLVDRLAIRNDGFSDGQRLITKPEGYGPVVEGRE